MPQEIYRKIHQAVDNPGNQALQLEALAEIQQADTSELVRLAGLLTSDPGHRPANIKAHREAIMAEIECKNTALIVRTMERLDASANRLGLISLALAVIGALLAGVQVYQGFFR